MGRFVHNLRKVIIAEDLLKLGSEVVGSVSAPPGVVVGIEISHIDGCIWGFTIYNTAEVIKFV